jgi:hypothetical protein
MRVVLVSVAESRCYALIKKIENFSQVQGKFRRDRVLSHAVLKRKGFRICEEMREYLLFSHTQFEEAVSHIYMTLRTILFQILPVF